MHVYMNKWIKKKKEMLFCATKELGMNQILQKQSNDRNC
jgi:hypothetical protein